MTRDELHAQFQIADWRGNEAFILESGNYLCVAREVGGVVSLTRSGEARVPAQTEPTEAPAAEETPKPKRKRKPAESPADLDFDDL